MLVTTCIVCLEMSWFYIHSEIIIWLDNNIVNGQFFLSTWRYCSILLACTAAVWNCVASLPVILWKVFCVITCSDLSFGLQLYHDILRYVFVFTTHSGKFCYYLPEYPYSLFFLVNLSEVHDQHILDLLILFSCLFSLIFSISLSLCTVFWGQSLHISFSFNSVSPSFLHTYPLICPLIIKAIGFHVAQNTVFWEPCSALRV